MHSLNNFVRIGAIRQVDILIYLIGMPLVPVLLDTCSFLKWPITSTSVIYLRKNECGTLPMKFVGAIVELSKFNLVANFGPMLAKYLLNKLLMLPAPVTVSVSFDIFSGICLRLM